MLSERVLLVWLPRSRVINLARNSWSTPGPPQSVPTGRFPEPRDPHAGPTDRSVRNPTPGPQTGLFPDPGPTYRSLPRDRRQVFKIPGPTYRYAPKPQTGSCKPRANVQAYPGTADRFLRTPGQPQTGLFKPRVYVQAVLKKMSRTNP